MVERLNGIQEVSGSTPLSSTIKARTETSGPCPFLDPRFHAPLNRPVAVAIERVLFQSNVRTAMSVGQASGVVMAEAASRGLQVAEYSPNQVKDAVAGHGAADKQQVQQMVQLLLDLDAPPRPADAADAAAIALTHVAFESGSIAAAGRAVATSGAVAAQVTR